MKTKIEKLQSFIKRLAKAVTGKKAVAAEPKRSQPSRYPFPTRSFWERQQTLLASFSK